VHLDAELRPDFPLQQLSIADDEWAIVFELSTQRLNEVASAVSAQILQFPVRKH
jgi:hypothetical protein